MLSEILRAPTPKISSAKDPNFLALPIVFLIHMGSTRNNLIRGTHTLTPLSCAIFFILSLVTLAVGET